MFHFSVIVKANTMHKSHKDDPDNNIKKDEFGSCITIIQANCIFTMNKMPVTSSEK